MREDREDREIKDGPSVGQAAPPPRRQLRSEVHVSGVTSHHANGGHGGGRGRCFVSNLAWQVCHSWIFESSLIVETLTPPFLYLKTGWQDLKDKFREAGRVVHADVMLDETGRSKGWGIVEFETQEEVGGFCMGVNNLFVCSGTHVAYQCQGH